MLTPVFERFTESARQVVVKAQENARLLNHAYIGTEHLLLGLLWDGADGAADVLVPMGLTFDVARDEIVAVVGLGEEVPSGQIPFTPRAKRTLELALREALSLGHSWIAPGHILLGLIREHEGVAMRVILDSNLSTEEIRERVIDALREAGPPENMPHPQPRAHVNVPRMSIAPDDQVYQLLKRAGGAALTNARDEYGVADLIAALRANPATRHLLDQDSGDGEAAG
jgi:ATP-dependent Clp protease ATP-binding subunit ClpA